MNALLLEKALFICKSGLFICGQIKIEIAGLL
jgi:hypothetical protein